MKRLLIIGAGGHGRVVADCASSMQRFDTIGFLDSHFCQGDSIAEWDVIGRPEEFASFADDDTEFFVAIGNNLARRQWLQTLFASGVAIATIVDASAVVSTRVTIGAGTLLAPGAVVNIDSHLGCGVIVNTRAHIDHDGKIGDFSHIAPGVHMAGNVTVGKLCFVGIGTSVIQGVTIAENVQTGAGAAVVSDISNNTLAVGVPAKPVKALPVPAPPESEKR